MSLPPAFQNKYVVTGLAVAALVALGFLFSQFLGGNSAPPPEAYMGTGAGAYNSPPGGPPGGPGPMGSSAYGPPGEYGSGAPGVSGYGSSMASGGAPVAGAGAKPVVKKAGPRPPTRHDPFKMPTELVPQPPPIDASLPPADDYVNNRMEEATRPTPDQYIREVPDPPMRMAGALWGNRVYGVLEINGKTYPPVTPGDKIGIYRVERIERDRIVLSRPSKHGRRTVDALLAGNPSLAAQYPTGDSGIPGGPTGYGGPPGAGMSGGGSGGPMRSGG